MTFQIHGGGHGFAIYEVSKDTRRDQLGQYLCRGEDPAEHCRSDAASLQPARGQRRCGASHQGRRPRRGDRGAAQPHQRAPGQPGVVPGEPLDVGGRGCSSSSAERFPPGPTSNGQLLTYQFLKSGRHLVNCMNRVSLPQRLDVRVREREGWRLKVSADRRSLSRCHRVHGCASRAGTTNTGRSTTTRRKDRGTRTTGHGRAAPLRCFTRGGIACNQRLSTAAGVVGLRPTLTGVRNERITSSHSATRGCL